MLLVFDVELETVGAVADVEVKDLVPDGVQVVGDVARLEQPRRSQVGGDVRIGLVLLVNVKECRVRVRQVLGGDDLDVEPAVQQ